MKTCMQLLLDEILKICSLILGDIFLAFHFRKFVLYKNLKHKDKIGAVTFKKITFSVTCTC